ncbi:MAG: fatty acyl-AMP ligase, partial [Micromonosporaceae bacterium]|nr:fatty acyl-AMP ligase [Micromonosporaceae bacterium]
MDTRTSCRVATVADLLRSCAQRQPDGRAYTFLDRDGQVQDQCTFAELDRRAAAIAERIQADCPPDGRVLILHPPSLEYVASFFGCMYAGTVAVTAYPPNFTRRLDRLRALIHDSRPALAITTARIVRAARAHFIEAAELGDIGWLDTATVAGDGSGWIPPSADPERLAFLQYTSGTTGTPRGVMVRHGNLVHNARIIYDAVGYRPDDRMVSWLPPYHDMGLIAGLLMPVYGGFETVLMAPATFALDPYQWLSAISRHRGTTSYAPNFAYDLCVDRIGERQRADLDLSSWRVAVLGAEPTRAATLRRFIGAFETSGFCPAALRSGYGLAESTLAVAVTREFPRVLDVQASAIERGEIVDAVPADRRELVSTGLSVDGDQRVRIVAPDTGEVLADGGVGEVWLSGPSVAAGYWQRPEQTVATFEARTSTGDGPYLRTGDLGFLRDGELYVTGRIKDMIIVRGRNLYPQDVEQCALASHPGLRSGFAAACGLDLDGEERLLVVAELRMDGEDPDVSGIIKAVRQAVGAEFDVTVHAVVLVRSGTLPRTSSGKVQRHVARIEFSSGGLVEVARWVD